MDISKLYLKLHELELLVEKILGDQNIDIDVEQLFIVLNLKDFHKGRVIIDSIKAELLDTFCVVVEVFANSDITKLKENGIVFRICNELQASLDCVTRIGKTWGEISEIRDDLITTRGGPSRQDIKTLIGLFIKKRDVLTRYLIEANSHFEAIDYTLKKVVLLPKQNPQKRMKCPITGETCTKISSPEANQVFVGLQFTSEYYSTTNLKEVLTEVLGNYGLSPFFADEHFEPSHISCEICYKIQQVSICIFEISDSNPNVMFELGLACTQGKIAVLLSKKDSRGTKISDLAGFHRIQYGDLIDCRRLLTKYLEDSKTVKKCLALGGA